VFSGWRNERDYARRVWDYSPGMAGSATLAAVWARLAIVAVVLGIAGCASAPTATTAYVGEFTGEFVDGVPLYRLPAIEVVGTRRGVDKDT
jgi:hypothetical protein